MHVWPMVNLKDFLCSIFYNAEIVIAVKLGNHVLSVESMALISLFMQVFLRLQCLTVSFCSNNWTTISFIWFTSKGTFTWNCEKVIHFKVIIGCFVSVVYHTRSFVVRWITLEKFFFLQLNLNSWITLELCDFWSFCTSRRFFFCVIIS